MTKNKILEKIKKCSLPGSKEDFFSLYDLSINNEKEYWGEIMNYFLWEKKPSDIYRKKLDGSTSWFNNGRLNYFDVIFSNKQKESEAIVVYDQAGDRKSYSFGELETQVKVIAENLQSVGVKKGDTALFCVEDKEVAALGGIVCLGLGIKFGYIYSRFPTKVIEKLCKNVQPDYVFYEPFSRRNEFDNPDFNKLPKLKKVIIAGSLTQKEKGEFDGAVFFDDLKKGEKMHQGTVVSANQANMIFFSSGTTSIPKTVISGTAGMYLANLPLSILMAYAGEKSTFWIPLDFAWGAVPIVSFYPALFLGYKIVLDKKHFDINSDRITNIINEEKITSLFLAPSFIERYNKRTRKGDELLKIKKLFFGGDLATDLFFDNCKKIFDKNVKMINLYGQIEFGSGILSSLPNDLTKKKSKKLYPLLGVSYKIKNKKRGVGELFIKNSMPCLLKRIVGNRKKFLDLWEDGFGYINTGDLAKVFEDGGLEIIGRAENVIMKRGRYLDLKELEEIILGLVSVKSVKAVLFEDKVRYLVIFVEEEKGKEVEKKEVFNLIKKEVGSYAFPKEIVVVPEMPRTSAGKIRIGELKKGYERRSKS